MAELMPMTWPCMLTRAPPELPGLIGASVWIASITVCWLFWPPSPATVGRCSELTMPEVTVPDRPYGAPIATTAWPTWRLLAVPNDTTGRPVTPCALMTAMSDVGSRPRMVAFTVRPLEKITWIWLCPAPAVAASAITWLLVRIWPSLEMMMPEPVSPVTP